jgi:hypothetical protein
MYASFLNLPAEGRHSRALHLKLFTVPSPLMTFYETINTGYYKCGLSPKFHFQDAEALLAFSIEEAPCSRTGFFTGYG